MQRLIRIAAAPLAVVLISAAGCTGVTTRAPPADSNSATAQADPVEALLNAGRVYGPEQIRKMDDAIAAFPEHPKILDLKYHRLGALMGESLETEYQRSVSSQFQALARECEAAGRQDLAVDCLLRSGSILQDALGDLPAAYRLYNEMAEHPALKESSLSTDVRRMELYARLIETAWRLPQKDVAAIRKYASWVMAYTYLGVEDRNAYRELRNSYTRAVGVYMLMLSMLGEIETIEGLEIPPSQQELHRMRDVLVETAIAVRHTKEGAAQAVGAAAEKGP